MKKYQPGENMQVLFVCPKCGRQLAWALPAAEMQCPKCGTWVGDAVPEMRYVGNKQKPQRPRAGCFSASGQRPDGFVLSERQLVTVHDY